MASRHSCPVRYLWTDIPSGTSAQRISKAAGSSSTATNRIELPAKLQSISISRQLALKIETSCHLRVSFRQAGMVVAGRGGIAQKRRKRSITRGGDTGDRKSTRLNSSHLGISYAVFCLK